MIHETRRRSLVKAVSFRIISISLDTLILATFLELDRAFGLAVVLEGACFLAHYSFERIADKIQWGRYIE